MTIDNIYMYIYVCIIESYDSQKFWVSNDCFPAIWLLIACIKPNHTTAFLMLERELDTNQLKRLVSVNIARLSRVRIYVYVHVSFVLQTTSYWTLKFQIKFRMEAKLYYIELLSYTWYAFTVIRVSNHIIEIERNMVWFLFVHR